MTKFWAFMHTGNAIEFVGESWKEGGFAVNDQGDPVRDSSGNSVANFSVSVLNESDWQSWRNAYAGEGNLVGDREEFLRWLENEGLSAEAATGIAAEVAEELTERCAYCNHDVPYRNPSQGQPAVDDDDTWSTLASEHDEDCEWILTRAHRLEVAE